MDTFFCRFNERFVRCLISSLLSGRVFMLPGGPLSLQYKVKSWALTTEPAYMLVSTPPGVFCPAHDRKFIPKLANQFSLTMETVIEVCFSLFILSVFCFLYIHIYVYVYTYRNIVN